MKIDTRTPLEEDRQALDALHFSKEMLSRKERQALALAEAMLRRIDAALTLCDRVESSDFYESLSYTNLRRILEGR